MRQALYVVGLTAVWVMLWDDFSVANTVSGVLVAGLLLVVFPTSRRILRARPIVIRPLAVLRLAGYILSQLVISNVRVAREGVAPRQRIRTGIIACRLRTTPPGMITLSADILEISPGTMIVDARSEPPTLYVHFLMLREPLEARHEVAHLERLVLRAFGADTDVPAREEAPS